MTTATIEELQDLKEAQANHVRETWISAMELRLVKNELQKCHQYEGVNHYSVCEPLANKYVDMLKDHKVKGYKIQDKDV